MSNDGLPRMWGAFRDGEELFQVTGPDAEAMVRSAVETGAADRIAYRDGVRPTRDNGYSLWGPWIDDEPWTPEMVEQFRKEWAARFPLAQAGILAYDMPMPKPWPVTTEGWTPLRNVFPRAAKCYRLPSGARVHVKPSCRC